MLRIGILVGSTRPGRRAETVAQWVDTIARQHASVSAEDVSFEVVDLAGYQLPLLDEPVPAAVGAYEHDHTRRWAKTVGALDGFVIVTPEYNHSVPAALKNAIDFLFTEWNDKAAGFVSYGFSGGVRAVEQLRLALAEVKVACARSQVALSLRDDFDSGDGVCKPAGHHEQILLRVLDEVIAWAGALQPLRIPDAAGAMAAEPARP